MDITLCIRLFVLSAIFLVFVLLRVRRGRYLLKYSFIWIVLSILGVVASVFPDWVSKLAHVLGFSVPSNFVYFALIGFLLISNIIFCGILSRQEILIKNIIQEISILKGEFGAQANEDCSEN